MALQIWEKAESREQTIGPDSPEYVLLYGVLGTEDDGQVRQIVQEEIPAYVGHLAFQNYNLTPLGGGAWDVEVRYAQKDHTGPDSPTQGGATDGTGGEKDGKDQGKPSSAKSWEFSFDTSGGTHKLLKSLATRHYNASMIDHVDYAGAILVKKEDVEGVDVTIPNFAFTIKASITPPLNAEWLYAMYRMTGKVNSKAVGIYARGTILTFKAGELHCQGATGSVKEDGDWEVSLKIAASENVTGLTIEGITGIEKKGWEFLWVRYKDAVKNNILAPEAVEVYVEQVYETFDFLQVIGN